MNLKKIAIFASGTGSNALNIITHFKDQSDVKIALLISNKKNAPIVESAKREGITVLTFSNEQISAKSFLRDICTEFQIDFIVLAGFLRKIPTDLIDFFPEKIVNIHPSLLPKYGGEGMYGKHVHEAVLANKDSKTGITIHFVNSEYDKGRIIAQFSCDLSDSETLESIQNKIHALEMENFPKVIAEVLKN